MYKRQVAVSEDGLAVFSKEDLKGPSHAVQLGVFVDEALSFVDSHGCLLYTSVATKNKAKQVVAENAASVNMPYVIERWPVGMLTNFPTIRQAVKKMATIDKLSNDGTYSNLSKREVLQISRQRAKLEKRCV